MSLLLRAAAQLTACRHAHCHILCRLGPLFKSWRHAQALIELFIKETQQLVSTAQPAAHTVHEPPAHVQSRSLVVAGRTCKMTSKVDAPVLIRLLVVCCRTAPAAAVQEAPLTWAPARMHLRRRQVGDNGEHACAGLLQATRMRTDMVHLPVPSSPCAAHTCAGCCLDLRGAASCTASAHTSGRCPAACLPYTPSFDYSCDSHDAAAKARHTVTGSSSTRTPADAGKIRCGAQQDLAVLRQCCVSQGQLSRAVGCNPGQHTTSGGTLCGTCRSCAEIPNRSSL